MDSLTLVPGNLASPYSLRTRPWPTRHVLVAAVIALAIWGASIAPAFAAGTGTYRVQPGDTLSGIAQRFGVSVAQLMAINSLRNPNFIVAGQTLNLGTKAAFRPPSATGPGPSPTLSTPRIMSAPYFNQFDGSVYAESNCGPTALASALGALGVNTNPIALRHLAARQMGFDNPDDGTTWEALVYAARMKGTAVGGLYSGRYYRIWSIGDLKREFSQGHPVLLLVRYRALPGHTQSSYWGDHYIVGLGFDSAGNLVYDDPAYKGGPGAYLKISQGQLLRAWNSTAVGLIRTAMAVSK